MVENTAIQEHASDSSNEKDLARAAQKGDINAFNELVLIYQNAIYNLACRLLDDEDAAEDVTQNTFVAAYRNLPSFRNGSFRGWLYRIATNACYDELRSRKRHPTVSLEYEDDDEERYLPAYDYPGSGISPEKAYETRELDRIIQESLNQLDPGQRAIITLVDIQSIDYLEASQALGIPLGTVKSRLVRSRRRLRELLERQQVSATVRSSRHPVDLPISHL